MFSALSMSINSPQSDRWAAICQRQASADGTFWYGVKTTGIYCRPTCASRQPKPANVVYFDSCRAAEAAGFRPCKRCQPQTDSPQQQQTAAIAAICQRIEQSATDLTLAEMAAIVGLSPAHFQRLFKRIVGVTPKAYTIAQRQQRVRTELQEGTSVTQAIYDAGFATSSRFYEQSAQILGMTPTNYQRGAKGIAMQFAVQPTSLGWVLVAATAQGICAISLDDSAEALTLQLQQQFPGAQIVPSDDRFADWVAQVVALIEAPQQGLSLPLDIQGTAFQHRVWQALQTIPPGATLSYSAVAQQIGQPQAVRAVARACASNKLAVAIPCHRVVGSDGALKGYRWGSDRKRILLDREST
jgi:AraC family transcriptional regulator, regulatory protein of adaptative response / methylated-DNA-[protein]-cysteine methyltransferase